MELNPAILQVLNLNVHKSHSYRMLWCCHMSEVTNYFRIGGSKKTILLLLLIIVTTIYAYCQNSPVFDL